MITLAAKTLVFAGLLTAPALHAKTFPEINAQITIGENVASFRIYAKGGTQYFTFQDSFGKSSNGSLSQSGYDFVVSKANDVFAYASENTEKCLAKSASVKITHKGKSAQRKGCLNTGTNLSKKLNQLVSRLQLLL